LACRAIQALRMIVGDQRIERRVHIEIYQGRLLLVYADDGELDVLQDVKMVFSSSISTLSTRSTFRAQVT
jgi:hypothetical protein